MNLNPHHTVFTRRHIEWKRVPLFVDDFVHIRNQTVGPQSGTALRIRSRGDVLVVLTVKPYLAAWNCGAAGTNQHGCRNRDARYGSGDNDLKSFKFVLCRMDFRRRSGRRRIRRSDLHHGVGDSDGL